jgi:hypothetical protein
MKYFFSNLLLPMFLAAACSTDSDSGAQGPTGTGGAGETGGAASAGGSSGQGGAAGSAGAVGTGGAIGVGGANTGGSAAGGGGNGSGGTGGRGATGGSAGAGTGGGPATCPDHAPRLPQYPYTPEKCTFGDMTLSCPYATPEVGTGCRTTFMCRCLSNHMGGADCNWMGSGSVCPDGGP